MSLWSRFTNSIRPGRIDREFDEELELHVANAVAEGRDAQEARRALGPALQHRERARDIQSLAWLDGLRMDLVFALRQLRRNKVTSAAAILSLALAIGACTSAFRLIDALLLRPLPIEHPERLYVFYREARFGDKLRDYDGCAYPMFAGMRDAVKEQATAIAAGFAERVDVTYASDAEMEKAYWQFVSGSMFPAFGIQPAAGRLLTGADDVTPLGHPVAVLSYDYWTRRFGRDPRAVGRTFRMGKDVYQIIGVAERGFTGTEPGTMIDVYVPTMMEPASQREDSTWLRTFVHLKAGANPQAVEQAMHAVASNFERERSRKFLDFSKQRLSDFLSQKGRIAPAASGVSSLQKYNRVALMALAILVGLVLLIACANVANLMTARAAARGRELALRVSIGAGRARLMQLVLVESACVALLAAVLGAVFSWWATPFMVSRMNPPDNPVRLAIPVDARVLCFGVVLALAVVFLFGLAPALRASRIQPAVVLKGGSDPHSRRRLMHALVALQVTFCFIVLFTGGLFIATYQRLAAQSTGFSAEKVVVLQTVTTERQPPGVWQQAAARLTALPGVESVSFSDQTLLSGSSWNGFITTPVVSESEELAFFRSVSRGWLETLRIPLLAGRGFRPTDIYPKVAIVNETFARTYFRDQNPVGQWFARRASDVKFEIIGVVRDARYRNMRDPMLPVAFFPIQGVKADGSLDRRDRASVLVRVSHGDPASLGTALRKELAAVPGGFRVSSIRTQQEINDSHTVRERLLAMLALFFATVALLLAAVGLYGVLDYSVLQRRREIGIRMALGASAPSVAGDVTLQSLVMVGAGSGAGLALGLVSQEYIETLLFGVRATDAAMMIVPCLTLLAIAMAAVAPAALRAARTDPASILRAD